jgi:phosphoglycerate dehydrogenase-like enzyme
MFILAQGPYETIYGEEHAGRIAELVAIDGPPQTAEFVAAEPGLLRDVEIILSGWGAPVMDEAFLAAAPKLEAVFYGAGSVRHFVTDALWERGIVVSSGWAMNAVPVAEYALAQILFSLKRGWQHAMTLRERGAAGRKRLPVPGAFGSKVGIISLGAIGRRLCELLRPFDLEVLAHDPFVGPEVFEELGARQATLDEIFEQCPVVSLHAPNLPSTRGMITGAHFERMQEGATFLNTARGDVVRESEMVDVLRRRADLWAVLDVLANNDRGESDDIHDLPNVILTPHIAGAMDRECRRMGGVMVEELQRYLNGELLLYRITPERLATMA